MVLIFCHWLNKRLCWSSDPWTTQKQTLHSQFCSRNPSYPSSNLFQSSASSQHTEGTAQIPLTIAAIPQLLAMQQFWHTVHCVQTAPAEHRDHRFNLYLIYSKKIQFFIDGESTGLTGVPKGLCYFFLKPPAHTPCNRYLDTHCTLISSTSIAGLRRPNKEEEGSGAYFLQERAVPYTHRLVTHRICWKWINPS